MTETKYLHFVLDEIGYGVHNLNTIAVALSNLPSDSRVDPALNIKWEPKNVNTSSIAARRFAVRSSIVFAAETLFEYMNSISDDAMWKELNNGLDFSVELAAHDSKAKRFSEFCKSIPDIEKEWYLLVELMCHWRNRIVHASTSKAQLSSSDRQYLESKSSDIYETFHHFDIKKTLADYEADKVTLKEATTLITFLIKCCRKIDEYYLSSISNISDNVYCDILDKDEQLIKIRKQQHSDKRTRQITKYIEIKLSSLSAEKLVEITTKYT
ncbi:MAG: hypothetical protein MJK12_17560 [Colwellia sp.]|nr:hypothetical protein [Colwellia sp.]